VLNGGFVGPDEYVVKGDNGEYQACHVEKATVVQPANAKNVSEATPAPSPSPAARTSPIAAPLSAPILSQSGEAVAAPRVQGEAGYQYETAKLGTSFDGISFSTSHVNVNAANWELIGNLNRYIGIVGDFSLGYNGIGGTNLLMSYEGGAQVNPLGRRYAFSPFAHATYGASTLYAGSTVTGLSWQAGGGLDYQRREKRLGYRLVSFDYGQVRKDGYTLSIIKIGTGITF
jgi:hypothetical protein